jgi:glutathione S-transferase
MITLWHCADARSFRPLWALEELGLPYDLKMLPFPPRFLAREYLAENPLGTIPLLVDGETRMTESAAIVQYLSEAEHSGQRPPIASYDLSMVEDLVEPNDSPRSWFELWFTNGAVLRLRAAEARPRRPSWPSRSPCATAASV